MRLNMGCGPQFGDGWVNADIPASIWADADGVYGEYADLTDTLPWPNDHFDYCASHHVLMMLEWPYLVPALTELRRVIVPGGLLRVSVPDLVGAVKAWGINNRDWFPIDRDHEESVDGALCLYVSQAGATRSVFTVGWLAELFERAGFTESWQAKCGVTFGDEPGIVELDTRCDESIYMEARA